MFVYGPFLWLFTPLKAFLMLFWEDLKPTPAMIMSKMQGKGGQMGGPGGKPSTKGQKEGEWGGKDWDKNMGGGKQGGKG